MVDARYIILLVILVLFTYLTYKRPGWAVAVGIGLAATALAYTIMFD